MTGEHRVVVFETSGFKVSLASAVGSLGLVGGLQRSLAPLHYASALAVCRFGHRD